MGRQDGVLQFTGQVGGLSFFKSKQGYLVRKKGGITADRIRTDPAFERTRENGLEFGRAGRANRLVRAAFRSRLINSADSLMTSRMSREMMKVIQADTINARGARIVLGPNTTMLQGFEFNELAKLGGSLYAPYTTGIDRAAGTLTVSLPEFIPQNMIMPPSGSTHAQLVAEGAEINFTDSRFVVSSSQSAVFALNGQLMPPIELTLLLPANSTLPLFLAFGIAFFQEVNGVQYPLKNGAYNALALVQIDGGV